VEPRIQINPVTANDVQDGGTRTHTSLTHDDICRSILTVLYLTEVKEHGSSPRRKCRPMMSSNGRQRMRTSVRRTTHGEEHDATG
jgi:hypothetical protein